jgi:hypothetical protein
VRFVGGAVRFDENLPFIFVDVLRAIANGTTHFQEPRSDALESPGTDGEPGYAQSFRDLDVRQNSFL